MNKPVHAINFSMRRLRADLHARLRVVATLRSQRTGKFVALETVVNDALAAGLAQLEKEELK